MCLIDNLCNCIGCFLHILYTFHALPSVKYDNILLYTIIYICLYYLYHVCFDVK